MDFYIQAIINLIFLGLGLFWYLHQENSGSFRSINMNRANRNNIINDYGIYENFRQNFTFASNIYEKIRRYFAVKKSMAFLTGQNQTYYLRNDNVEIIYDEEKLEMTITDIQQINEFVISKKECQKLYGKNAEISMKATFNDICSNFTNKTNFFNITEFLKWRYEIEDTPNIEENNKYADLSSNNYYTKQYIKPEKPIDINSANENELAKLPGISIILAKKIIDYRNINNGFKSKNEFYEKMNIKPHFQEQLNYLIIIGDFKWSKEFIGDNERTIDF